MSKAEEFLAERKQAIEKMGTDREFAEVTRRWFDDSCRHGYSYNFTWMGRPIIQYPQDMIAMQELIWRVQPDAIVETGVAHGGSIIYYASLLELLGGDRRVIGVDIEIRPHNRAAIESHPMFKRIDLVEGSSVAAGTLEQVKKLLGSRRRVLVSLDSNHTAEHVAQELELYAPLVPVSSYLVVFDTVIEQMPSNAFPNRPWGPGNNPYTAVQAFLRAHPEFEVDVEMDHKLMVSVAPQGYLRRVR